MQYRFAVIFVPPCIHSLVQAVLTVKDATNAAHELSLAEGLKTEKRIFYATFATDDRDITN